MTARLVEAFTAKQVKRKRMKKLSMTEEARVVVVGREEEEEEDLNRELASN